MFLWKKSIFFLQQKYMILQLFVTLLLLISLYVLFRFYIIPKKRYRQYSIYLKKLGYRVLQLPFSFMAAPYFQRYSSYLLSHGDSLYQQKNQFQNYDIILSNVLDTICLTLEDLNLVKQFYSNDNVNRLIKHPSFSEGVKMSLGHGIMFSEGITWKRKRKIISKAFNYDLLTKNAKVISEIAEQTIKEIQKENQLQKDENCDIFMFEPTNLGFRIFSRVMLKCFFESEFKDNKINQIDTHQFLQQLFNQVNKLSGSVWSIFLGDWAYQLGLSKQHRNLKKKVQILHDQVKVLIRKKVQQYKKSATQRKYQQNQDQSHIRKSCNLLQNLLQQKRKGQQTYEQKQLLEEFCTFLIVGTDTTTSFLNTMLYYLSKYPLIQKKVRDEISRNISSNQDIYDMEVLKKLFYLEAVQNEVIRMAGPSATCFIRVPQKDFFLGNIRIKKGIGLFVQPIANHYNPAYFKDPHYFNPERWLESKSLHPPFSFTGFFGGPRTCIGKQLSYLQSKIVLIKLLIRYQKLQICLGGERMQMKFLYGPQRYFLKVEKQIALSQFQNKDDLINIE